MARRELINAHQDGTKVPDKETEVDEADSPESQEAVLSGPTYTEFQTVDATTYYLPDDFSLKDIYRNKVTNSISGFVATLCFELDKLGEKLGPEMNQYALTACLLKETVQSALADLLAVVLQKPRAQFDNTLDAQNLVKVYWYVIGMASKNVAKSGESKPPKAKKAHSGISQQ